VEAFAFTLEKSIYVWVLLVHVNCHAAIVQSHPQPFQLDAHEVRDEHDKELTVQRVDVFLSFDSHDAPQAFRRSPPGDAPFHHATPEYTEMLT
jgi:hypothetical protein